MTFRRIRYPVKLPHMEEDVSAIIRRDIPEVFTIDEISIDVPLLRDAMSYQRFIDGMDGAEPHNPRSLFTY